MKGRIHQILNDRSVMKEVELIIELPGGSLKYYTIRKGETIQVTKPVSKGKAMKKKAKKKLEEL